MPSLKVSAPGKIILSGEHAVVYGYPAILSAVNKRLTISALGDKKKIDSDIPIGCGMGSSAAYAVAISAINRVLKREKWDLAEINRQAYKMEKKQHGNPSGGDNTISTYGGFLWYRKETESFKTFSPITIKRKIPEFYILDSGKPEETTGEMVAGVKKSIRIFGRMEYITKSFLRFLTGEENSDFGELIRENERLLEKIGVVSDSTIKLIKNIEKLDGSAKISGAGGKKSGSGILLVFHKDLEVIKHFADKSNFKLIKVRLGEEGVKIES